MNSNSRRELFNIGSIFRKLAWAAGGGLLGGLLTLFSDEIRAYAYYTFVGGNLRGEYVLKTYTFEDSTKQWVSSTDSLTIKHGGTRVFGTLSSTKSPLRWSVFGYFRSPVLALTYENEDPAAVGTGTFTLQQDLPYAFWGHWIGVQCDLNTNQRFLAQCPCIAYRKDHPELEANYKKFMDRDCVRITLESGPCPPRKTTYGS